MSVTIEVSYNPPSDFTLPSPPYYRPATSVTLTCHAHGNITSYYWTSTCSNYCFAHGTYSQSISDSILTSNDAGIHTCTATDADGTTGSNSTEMKLIGKGCKFEWACTALYPYRYKGHQLLCVHVGEPGYEASMELEENGGYSTQRHWSHDIKTVIV